MSRLLTTAYRTRSALRLPVINWHKSSLQAPVALHPVKAETLPDADIAVITWTVAEWSALDHVFLNSDTSRGHEAEEWRDNWLSYWPVGTSEEEEPLLYYQLVTTGSGSNATRILLVKSEVHLAHPPYITGVTQLTETIIRESGVKTIISTGTAGGATVNQPLGDVVLTTQAHIELEKSENTGHCTYNKTTVTGADIFNRYKPDSDGVKQLMLPLAEVWNESAVTKSLAEVNERSGTSYTAADLVNKPLQPDNLKDNQITPAMDTPLLTTDFYFIADGGTAEQYCFLEMDDAVIGHTCQQAGVGFGFIRNVSDPVVVTTDAQGKAIPPSVREDWSGIVYTLCGFYTTYNSALTCWSALCQMDKG
ncbi:MAG: hypothetical protein CMI02_19060 [Oceanospirillaceae bacterium]|nr:hypothetical protein [Oceanospirillaceae bacterium]MBT14128.1 hypothetical protein [Oceanospirillaceae bacterium]|tara:strand:+ start:35611 stop:36702 length:1092 start_codon:yes stop_codon:yes gene_type:complete